MKMVVIDRYVPTYDPYIQALIKYVTTHVLMNSYPKMHHTLFQPLKDYDTITIISKEEKIVKAVNAIFDICKDSYAKWCKANARFKMVKMTLNVKLKGTGQCVDEGCEMEDSELKTLCAGAPSPRTY
jgi:hypothetical protein